MAVNLKATIVLIVLVLIAFIVTFSIVGNTAGDVRDAADSVTDANNCSDSVADGMQGLLTYNYTSKYCHNTSDQPVYLAEQIDLPLNTLFSRSGVVLLVFMAVLVLVLIGIGFHAFKKK